MKKKNLLAILVAFTLISSVSVFASCGAKEQGNTTEQSEQDTNKDTEKDTDTGSEKDTGSDEHKHAWTEWKINKYATCKEQGEKERSCTGCTEKETKVIPLARHTFQSGYTCEVCEITLTVTENLAFEEYGDDAYSVTGIGTAFTEENIVIPYEYNGKPVTYIGYEAFKGRENIKTLVIPSTVEYVGTSAFENCTNLTEIFICDGVDEIGQNAFKGCTSLQSLFIPSSVYNMENNAFSGCTALQKVEIGNGIETLKEGMFLNCKNLTEVVLPERLKKIDSEVFKDCESLTEITIPSSVKTIEGWAFGSCKKLKNMYYEGTKTEWSLVDRSSAWKDGIATGFKVHCSDDEN